MNRKQWAVCFTFLAQCVLAENATAVTAPTSTDQRTVAKAGNAVAFDLYAQLRTRPGNLIFSPLSISSALAMAYAGANGRTAAEMSAALHFPFTSLRLHAAYGAMLSDLESSRAGEELHIANASWADQGHTLLPRFLAVLRASYGAEARVLPFRTAPDDARRTINAWVEEKTRQKIKDLLPPGSIDAMTRLVLTNAVYFKGRWIEQFDKKATRDEPFSVSATQKVTAHMMHRQKTTFSYAEFDNFQALEMSYQGKRYSMLVLLPKRVEGLSSLERALSAATLAEWRRKMKRVEVDVTLPRFTATQYFDLNRSLQRMGIVAAFDPNRADFSRINGSRNLFISAVVHKAFVDVNEEGTEAAAATGVVFGLTAFHSIPSFVADHPFLYFILDARSGGILFMGRVTDPTA
jgi:serpin B